MSPAVSKVSAAVAASLYLTVILSNISNAQLIEGKQPEKSKEAVVFPDGSGIKYSNSKKVKSVSLSQPFEVQGIMWPRGTRLEFDESGKIRHASVQQPVTVQGIVWPDGSYFSFTQAGKISYVMLGHTVNIQGKSFNRYERIIVDSNGKAHKAVRQGGPLTGGASADF